MRRSVWCLALMMAAVPAQAQQGKTAKGKCPANYYEGCLKKCAAVGGRIHLCPQYCTKRQAELGCS